MCLKPRSCHINAAFQIRCVAKGFVDYCEGVESYHTFSTVNFWICSACSCTNLCALPINPYPEFGIFREHIDHTPST